MFEISQPRPPHVEFKQVAIPDPRRSAELGYRVTKDVDRVFVKSGPKDCLEINAVDWLKQLRQKLVDDAHDAFPREWVEQYERGYEAWKQGQEPPLNGTSVKEWPILSPAQAQNFIAMRIPTIEDVAAMTEEYLNAYGMGSRELREKAREWLAKRDQSSNIVKENEELKAQLAELMERVKGLETAKKPDKPKRGRPAKTEEQAA